ncbi:unnamed protein product [Rotaria sordida]|uniref:Uncharacterized protein n=1 Tax=Rotaria sordida TaxID=392033 RepID=A0A815G3X9_9BILA|nr:unnamed protein product [Rotaria sordida]CAF1333522.1 unnamed protein product [Rotaria sordida]
MCYGKSCGPPQAHQENWLLILIGTVQSCCITKLSVPNSICANATWVQHGVTIAGGYGTGNNLNQFGASGIYGVRVDECASVYITDDFNHRIIKWDMGSTAGIIVAGGNGIGNQNNQVSWSHSVALDENGTIFVADLGWMYPNGNGRIQRWNKGATSGTTVINQGAEAINLCSCHREQHQ